MPSDSHLSDLELTSAIDNELSGRQQREVAHHLSYCWRCRARRSELERATEDVVRLQSQALIADSFPSDGPSARLRAQLAAISDQRPHGSHWRRYVIPVTLSFCGAAVTALLLLWLPSQRASAGDLPDAHLTPGATRLTSRDQVCQISPQADERSIPLELAGRVFQEYRIGRPRPRLYEVDYLISPALGGAEDIRNLWPQRYRGSMWTAPVKDALEDHLRRLVCEGKVDLLTAQNEIASDWIAAYRKYFHSNRPLPAHLLFVKDHPWE